MQKFEIKKSEDGQFYFVLKAANGETVSTSETYKTKGSCKKGIRAVKTAVYRAVVEDLTD